MLKLLLLGGLVSIFTALLGTVVALRIQYRLLSEKHIEREAWENAQEGHQRAWEGRLSKRLYEIELKHAGQVQQVQEEWKHWEARFNERAQQLSFEYAITQLPKIEETPLALNGQHHFHEAPPDWQPPLFYKANLQGRDFSHRYLGQANLREAQLAGANFYMADLRGACLAGANLAEANLIGANLAGADLRKANLTRANLLVTDLHQAMLHGANLLGAGNLTVQQIRAAVYDHATQLDPEIDITLTRLPTMSTKAGDPSITPEPMLQAFQPPYLLPSASAASQHTPAEALDTAVPTTRQDGTTPAMAG